MPKQKSWNVEIYRDFDSDFREDQLLVNASIREFLDREDKFILLGAKGLGKTLFLRYKSYLYHNRYGESIKFNENQTELVENINVHTATFSKEDLLRFRDEGLWRLIWELTLWIMLFRLMKEPIPTGLEKLIGDSRQISSVLTKLLNHRKKVDAFRDFVTELQNQKHKIQSGVALFIDDLDQSLQNLLSEPHRSDTYLDGKQIPSVELWVNAQMGLISAIYHLNRQNVHIKIYAAIRREAFEASESPLKINYEQHISRLEYNKAEIERIFNTNINLMDSTELFSAPLHQSATRFLGFETLPHRFAKVPNGKKLEENLFNFIYRHTYGRPRDIVLMGSRISKVVSSVAYKGTPLEERYNQIRTVVNAVSNELFGYYKQEVIPYWDDATMSNFVTAVKSNVIPMSDFHTLDEDTLKLYYNLGLLGIVKPEDHTGRLVQEFLPTATYNYRKFQNLPSTDFLLIHSSLDRSLLAQHTFGNFYNEYNIIGPGYDFVPQLDNSVRKVEDYYPHEISGNRYDSANPAAGHDFPLKNIYQNFFDFENAQNRYERFLMHWKMAEQVLGILGRICFCHRLEKEFKSGFYRAKQEESYDELVRYSFVRPYNAELPDDNSNDALDRFQDKLFGRYITLGCYLCLDMRIEWIHALLRQGKFGFNPEANNKDSAFSYLSRSFFIRDIRKDEPRNPLLPENRQTKQKIFEHLSIFEQISLSGFVRNATDEVHYLGWVEKEEHKTWLRENVLKLIWRPE